MLSKAIFLMIKENVGMMPVIQDNKVAGMIRLERSLYGDLENGPGRLSLFLNVQGMKGASYHGGRH